MQKNLIDWRDDPAEPGVWRAETTAANGEMVTIRVGPEPKPWSQPDRAYRWEITWPDESRTMGFRPNPFLAAASVYAELESPRRPR